MTVLGERQQSKSHATGHKKYFAGVSFMHVIMKLESADKMMRYLINTRNAVPNRDATAMDSDYCPFIIHRDWFPNNQRIICPAIRCYHAFIIFI